MTKKPTYKIVSRNPALKFFYKGSHSHPVRRTVLLIEENDDNIVGYELRVGRRTLSLKEAKKLGTVRTYGKENIAKMGDYCRLRRRKDFQNPDQSTVRRMSLLQLMEEGV